LEVIEDEGEDGDVSRSFSSSAGDRGGELRSDVKMVRGEDGQVGSLSFAERGAVRGGSRKTAVFRSVSCNVVDSRLGVMKVGPEGGTDNPPRPCGIVKTGLADFIYFLLFLVEAAVVLGSACILEVVP